MEKKTPRWESELWSYLSSGDGINCPVYKSCQLKKNDVGCYNKNERYLKLISEFIDKDELESNNPPSVKSKLSLCPNSGRIFQLVIRLADKFHKEARIDHLPVATNLITRADGDIPIEVRQVPLKAYRGAVWRLSNCWVVQLNSNDSTARQRFTLYHEIFHILAHSKATPVFKKAGCHREGTFNEMLADHFSGACLLPEKWVKRIWPKTKDVKYMAKVFDVPETVVWLELKHLGLI
jgi:hypothetical protein